MIQDLFGDEGLVDLGFGYGLRLLTCTREPAAIVSPCGTLRKVVSALKFAYDGASLAMGRLVLDDGSYLSFTSALCERGLWVHSVVHHNEDGHVLDRHSTFPNTSFADLHMVGV